MVGGARHVCPILDLGRFLPCLQIFPPASKCTVECHWWRRELPQWRLELTLHRRQ
jgi:hypothetical protein